MTNAEKFIEIMNKTFGAGFTKTNMKLKCSPCGLVKTREEGCDKFECEKCAKWWDKEYEMPARLSLYELSQMCGMPVYSLDRGEWFILAAIDDDDLMYKGEYRLCMTDGTEFCWSVARGSYPVFTATSPAYECPVTYEEAHKERHAREKTCKGYEKAYLEEEQ